MSAKHILLGLILAIFISAVALADGGFYGLIKYNNCDCNVPPPGSYDKVKITKESTMEEYLCGACCHYGGGYNTQGCDPQTYPPGWYRLVVVLDEYSNCYYGIPVRVYHGEDWQDVDLVVKGPESTPAGGDE